MAARDSGVGSMITFNAFEFLKDSQVLRVVNFCSKVGKGNCRGSATNSMDLEKEIESIPRKKKCRLAMYFSRSVCVTTMVSFHLYVSVH